MLRSKAIEYYRFMHLEFMDKDEFLQLPSSWNHLNVYLPGKTKLLHYTREPDQPVYKPGVHKHGIVWETALQAAIKAGAVDPETFQDALRLWTAPRIDHRPFQGLHPHYRRYLPLFDAKKGKKGK